MTYQIKTKMIIANDLRDKFIRAVGCDNFFNIHVGAFKAETQLHSGQWVEIEGITYSPRGELEIYITGKAYPISSDFGFLPVRLTQYFLID